MQRVTALIASAAFVCGTMSAEKPQPSQPSDYSLPVHVVASYQRGEEQVLEADIEGRRLELRGGFSHIPPPGVLLPGDYWARREANVAWAPKNPNDYDMYRIYELLMPDGKTREFRVTGVCAAEVKTCARP